MRLSIVRTDKANKQHLTVKSADWLMERIQTDTKAGEIARLRDFVVTFGKADDYDGDATIARIYPAVEMVKTENGNLEVCQYNGLVTLHVGDVLRREDIAAVKEAAAILPMTMAAFTGGDGKTTFCRMILPKELRWGFLENLDVSEKRQTLQAMHNFLLINLDEFNQISPKLQEGFLKNVIQLPSVKIKRPYGKHVEEFRRYASFIATTNESSVLSDPTGNRRFICVQLTAPVNTAYKPNYEALYGQAYTLIMSHEEQWWFTPEETKAIMEHNRQFELMPPALQYFNEHYEIVTNEEEGEWQSPTAIYERLRRLAGSGLKANGVAAFGRYLRNVPGLLHKRVANGRMYLVREKSSRY